jgi:hypothetical protein
MKGTMLIMRPSEPFPEMKLYNRSPTLDELKTAIGGGWLELVPHFTTIGIAVSPDADKATVMDCVAFCNEHGKNEHQPFNENATSAWEQSVRRITRESGLNDVLVGTVVVLYGDREFMQSL